MYIVYQITNTVNGKRYIGYSVNTVEERWRGHLEKASAARRGKKLTDEHKKNISEGYRTRSNKERNDG